MSTDQPATTTAGFDRRDAIRLGGLLAALLAVVAVVMLASGSDGSSKPASGKMEGVLTQVSQSKLVLQPSAGGQPQEFLVRPEDAQKLDIFHLEQHAADALPSIVFYETVDDTRYAVTVEDGPTPAG